MKLSDFERPVVLTGAGISVASGYPTYRGTEGLWTNSPDKEHDLVPPPAKMTDAEERRRWWDRLWADYFKPMRETGRAAEPNPAHKSLLTWGQNNSNLQILTQNIDGLHNDCSVNDVVELHGNIWLNKCVKPKCSQPKWFDDELHSVAPDCPKCGRPARPDVVLFTENLSERDVAAAHSSLWKCDLLLCVGTSLGVWPVNEFPSIARQFGAKLGIINVGPTAWDSQIDFEIDGRAEEELPRLVGESYESS